jgi:type I restriction-modification system DNA methylase subunit
MTPPIAKPALSRDAAKDFAVKWQGAKDEKSDAESFWNDFFRRLCGIDDTKLAGIEFQYAVTSSTSGNKNWIDVYWKNVAIIEHKSKGEDLDKAELQARGYLRSLPPSYRPRTIIISDFATFRLIDVQLNRTHDFLLKDLPENIHRFSNIVAGSKPSYLEDEISVDQQAAQLMANLYLELEANDYEGHETSVFLIRLLFLLFGDDTKMWEHNIVKKLLLSTKEDGSDVGSTINELFKTLNTPESQRKKNGPFNDFPYVNGGIFAEDIGEIQFTKRMRVALINAANYDWSTINPTIFGALFQLIKSKEERAALGEHYTSEENINKIIYPLFLTELQEKLDAAWNSKKALLALKKDLAKIKLLDPACGCGNFLVVAYRHLRQLELELTARLHDLDGKADDIGLDGTLGLSVGLHQLFGIEVLEWPSQVARVALFLTDHQENLKLEKMTGAAPNRFPIQSGATIINENALQIDWGKEFKLDNSSYIFGNPPFVGARLMNQEQKNETRTIWKDIKGAGDIDYVCNWFSLAAAQIRVHGLKAAFVATNSVSQGEQPAIIWGHLRKFGVEIDFAHQTFNWTNDGGDVAAVHCVVIGFRQINKRKDCYLWKYSDSSTSPELLVVEQLNGYLINARDILIESRSTPFKNSTPLMSFGSMPNDGGYLSDLSLEEYEEINKDVIAQKYLRKLIGAREMINNKTRFCLWLVGASPSDIKSSVHLKNRVASVKKLRTESKRAATQRLATRPAEFGEIRQPQNRYLAVPRVSSERRKYIPMAYFGPDVITNDSLQLIEDAPLSLFAILQSHLFTAWTATVSGRLKSDFRISAEITYNNFPFPELSKSESASLQESGNSILEIRAKYPNESLADLYDQSSMPTELMKAHQANDKLVLQIFGLKPSSSNAEILKLLFDRCSEFMHEGRLI